MLIVLVPWLPCVMVKLLGLADRVKLGAGVTVRLIVVVLFKLPDVPVIVTVAVPVAAVTLAVRVSVLLLVAGLGLNAAVTPLGRPDAERVTLPLKPFDGVMLIVLVPWLPCVMVTAFGEAERLKVFRVFTERLSTVVFVSVPDVPVIVTVTVPVAAVALAVKVSVLVDVAGFGLNAAVTPLGRPDAERVRLPLKPFDGVMLIVLVPWLPCAMVTAFGEAERLKVFRVFTERLSTVVFVSVPDVPVIVTVPVAAVALAVKVSVLVDVAGFGLNAAVTPLGRPDAERVTLPLKPFDGVMLIVL